MDEGDRLAAQSRWLLLLLAHLAGRRVRAHVELDDLLQEVFLRALALPGGLPPSDRSEHDLRPLLVTLSRHVVIDVCRALRAAKRRSTTVRLERSAWSRAGLRESAIAARGAGPATQALVAEDERALARALASLSAEHRRVIGLRQLEGLSAAEAACRMGRSEAAVHSLYRRALQAWEAAVARRS